MQNMTTFLHLGLMDFQMKFTMETQTNPLSIDDFLKKELKEILYIDEFYKIEGDKYLHNLIENINLVPACSLQEGGYILNELMSTEDLEYISFPKAKKLIENYLLDQINQEIKAKCFEIALHFEKIFLPHYTDEFLKGYKLMTLFYFYKMNK